VKEEPGQGGFRPTALGKEGASAPKTPGKGCGEKRGCWEESTTKLERKCDWHAIREVGWGA
jgi:hypothetical protein